MRNNTNKNGQVDWIKEAFKPIPKKPIGWYTATDICKQTGQGQSTVRRRLSEMVDDGQLEVMQCMVGNSVVKCYRKNEKKHKAKG